MIEVILAILSIAVSCFTLGFGIRGILEKSKEENK